MRLIHSECGGELVIDYSYPSLICEEADGHTDIYTPIKCHGCNARLGMLPNVAMGDGFVRDVHTGRWHATN